MGRMQLKIAETDDLSGFWYGSQAFALKGEPWSFIGWRMEKSTDTLKIYTTELTPGCGAEPHIMALERAGRGVRGTSGGKINRRCGRNRSSTDERRTNDLASISTSKNTKETNILQGHIGGI